MTLTEFLLARIAEDEADAREADSGRWLPEDKGITFEWDADDWHDDETQARLRADTRANQNHIANWHPARVLAECEAKRRIVEMHQRWDGDPNDYGQTEHVLRFLALPYSDHPDYDEAWRP